MGNPQTCSFIQATLCPGYSGVSPLWVSKAALAGRNLGSGGSFSYNGACYSLPANSQPQKPSGGGYASAGGIGQTFSSCSGCCTVSPASIFLDCNGTGTKTATVTGPPNATAYLSWTACWLVVNGVGPASGGGSTTITLETNGSGSFTVGSSSSVCPIPSPSGSASIGVGTTPGGGQCGAVAAYVGCPSLPTGAPTSLNIRVTVPLNSTGITTHWGDAGGSGTYAGTLNWQPSTGTWLANLGTAPNIVNVLFTCSCSSGCYSVPTWVIAAVSGEGGSDFTTTCSQGAYECSYQGFFFGAQALNQPLPMGSFTADPQASTQVSPPGSPPCNFSQSNCYPWGSPGCPLPASVNISVTQ
jgi:hypothetical protein